ncbi:MAG: DNA replication and repair protein RecF [Muribaculaceae bacterium]|nr:DNA replication and repair protein RecF [Muribaculaceae bacterium]
MIVKSLSLTNFKNIAGASVEFSPKVNCLLGDNGMGKSNLLDALYCLSYCKSFSGMTDAMLVRRGDTFAMLRATYQRRGLDEELSLGLQPPRRKVLKRGGKEYDRLADHIGAFPLVLLSPADNALVDVGAEERRRFLDQIAAQDDTRYLEALGRYNSALKQRNAMLRDMGGGGADRSLFMAVELQLERAANYLTRGRRRLVGELLPLFEKYNRAIAATDEGVALVYRSGILDSGLSLTELFERERRRDEILRHTTVGPHRDDLEITIGGLPARRGASQGQIKTITTALRLAQYELLHRSLGLRPLLLLDDIFDKLDAGRVASIMSLLADADGPFGQIFITDTNRQHLDEIVADLPPLTPSGEPTWRLWSVNAGEFTPLDTEL